MKIGIDISTVLNHGKDVGAGRYIINLVKNLFKIDSEDEFILTGRYITDEYLWLAEELRQHYLRVNESAPKPILSDSNTAADGISEDKSLKGNGVDKRNTNFADSAGETDGTDRNAKDMEGYRITSRIRKNKTGKLSFKLIKTTQKKLDKSNRIGFPPMELYGFKADVFHCPDFLIPPTLNNKIILTIHDLAFIRFPQFNFDWFVKKYTREVTKNALVAKRIIAVSYSTKNDIVEFFKINPEKVTVVHEAADEVFRKLPESEKKYSLQKKYNISKKFILSVGTIEPRKNYVTLIKAFNRLKSEIDGGNGNSCCKSSNSEDSKSAGSPFISGNSGKHNICSNLQLVIVGRTGWMSEPAIAEYNNSPFKDDIILAGRLSDAELLQMYNMAELFVYPSVFEGFGLPVVEAMQCGLPVIASNSSSIPELVDDKRLLFDPADEYDMLDKINLVLGDDKLKAELSEEALKNASRFSWKNTAQKTLEVYRKI